ncbi:MAG: hypothetical protein GEU83_01260 [Pseudonocardiaceae bacterium]|nr:hypothetical protein [Pseudonocardiaceae bacterium]
MNDSAWDGLANFAFVTGIFAAPGRSAGEGPVVRRGDAAHITAVGTKSMVGYKRWEDDPAAATTAAVFRSLSALIDTTAPAGAPDTVSQGAVARRPLPGVRELIQRFRRRFGGVEAHVSGAPQRRFRHHHVGSLPNPRSVDGSSPPLGTIGDAQNPADQ